MKFCPNCGAQMDDYAPSCSRCGAANPAAQNAAPAQPQNAAPAQPQYAAPAQPQYAAPAQPQYAAPAQPQYAAPAQPQYAAPAQSYRSSAPLRQLRTDRSLLKLFFLSLITCGIYGLVVYTKMSDEINVVASKYDGRKTMNYALLFFIIAPITLGIGALVWFHNFSDRIGNELRRRGLNYDFSAGTFWLWNILGSIIVVGPFIYIHKLATAMNMLNDDYNKKG